jgi:hypothetical protein
VPEKANEAGTLEWGHPERGTSALESIGVPEVSREFSMVLENPGERLLISCWVVPISTVGLQGE